MTSTEKRWFVAYVMPNMERKAAEDLFRMGIEYYLPIQTVRRKWSDRIKVVEQLLLPRLIFIHTTEAERLKPVRESRYLYQYMSNGGPFNPVVVPDKQMETFMNMVEYGQGTVRLHDVHLAPGDKVRAVSGPLKGGEFEIVKVGDGRAMAVRLGGIGVFTFDFSVGDVVPLEP